MKTKIFSAILLLGIAIFFSILPVTVDAEGLVPCGGAGEDVCTLCHLFSGVQNIINWGMRILTAVAFVVLVAMAIVYIVSAGNSQMMETAKTGIKNTLIGFTLVLLSWVIVNAVILLLPINKTFVTGDWWKVSCSTTASSTGTGTTVGGSTTGPTTGSPGTVPGAIDPVTGDITDPVTGDPIEGGSDTDSDVDTGDDTDANAGTITFIKPIIDVKEGETVRFSVTREGGDDGVIQVDYQTKQLGTSENFATEGADYIHTSGTLEWPSGNMGSRIISIPTKDDTIVEKDEQFSVLLFVKKGNIKDPGAVNVFIKDYDGLGTIDMPAGEVRLLEGSGEHLVEITRSGAVMGSGPLTVILGENNPMADDEHKAVLNEDYILVVNKVTWDDGENGTKYFKIFPINDTTVELDETTSLVLDFPSGQSALPEIKGMFLEISIYDAK